MAINTLDMVLVHRMFRHEFQDVLALIDDVPAGDVARAQQAWTAAGLPGNGPVSVDQLEQARVTAREAG